MTWGRKRTADPFSARDFHPLLPGSLAGHPTKLTYTRLALYRRWPHWGMSKAPLDFEGGIRSGKFGPEQRKEALCESVRRTRRVVN